MRKGFFLLLATFVTLASCSKRETSFNAPQWGELKAEVQNNDVQLSCSVSSPYGIVKASVLIDDGTMESNYSAVLDGNVISATLSDLEPRTNYSYRFIISNGVYEMISKTSSFKTEGRKPDIIIPDPYFQEYLLANFDFDHDGSISRHEALKVMSINVNTENISSVEGLQHFENIQELRLIGPENGSGQLTELNLSGNVFLRVLNCARNRIDSLDFSHNPYIEEINCSRNELTSLDVTMLPGLMVLDCSKNDFSASSIDLSKNPDLERLDVMECMLNTIDVTANKKLLTLSTHINNISSIDLSNNSSLTYCNFSDNRIKSFDVSNLVHAEYIHCGTDRLTEVFLPHFSTALKELVLDCNQLKECPDLSGYPNLEMFLIYNNQIPTVDVSNNSKLKDLRCAQNSLYYLYLNNDQNLDGITFNRSEERISSNTEIVRKGDELPIGDDGFKRVLLGEYDSDRDGTFSYSDALNVSDLSLCTDGIHSIKELKYFINLRKLSCIGDKSAKDMGEFDLDLSRCLKLTELHITSNNLDKLPNLVNNNGLKVLDLSNNRISGAVNLNYLTELVSLNLGYNEINRLHISSCTELEELIINGFRGDKLDFSNIVNLQSIELCDMAGMKEADLRYCPKLKSIKATGTTNALERIYVHSSAPLDGEIVLNDNISLIRTEN